MSKRILITGGTDGIGLATAEMLVGMGHQIILHGRNKEKLEGIRKRLLESEPNGNIDTIAADFSSLDQVRSMAKEVASKYDTIDVLINNAGIFMTDNTVTDDGLELRFSVNTIAPYILTKSLLLVMAEKGRIVNLSSAAQMAVSLKALAGGVPMSDDAAYAQSKLALTMWSFQMARDLKANGSDISVVAVNPKSFLGSKMVHQAYGRQGYDLGIGADVLARAALSETFAEATGKYYDNDRGQFANPHPDALDEGKRLEVLETMEQILRVK